MSTQDQSQPVVVPTVAVDIEHSTMDRIVEVSQSRAREAALAQREQFDFKQRLARLFAASGMFAELKGKSQEEAIAQAFVKIELGESMGFTPAESMQGIDVIQGRAAVGAGLRAARMKAGGYDWRFGQHNEKGCKLWLYRHGKALLNVDGTQASAEFTESEAGRISKNKDGVLKDNWRNYAKDMFFARAITRAQRWYAPEVLNPRILSTEEAVDLEEVIAETASRPMEPQRKSATKPTESPSSAPAEIPEVETFPEAFEAFPGTRVRFQGGIWEPNEDRSAWKLVEAPARRGAAK